MPAGFTKLTGPEVNYNFANVYIAAECSQPVSYNGEDRWFQAIPHGIQYLLYKTGAVTACVAEANCMTMLDGC
jgi:hypothetical protein